MASFKDIQTLLSDKSCDTESGLAMLDVLSIFSGKWKIIIACTLFEEKRFTEIQRLIPAITPRMLSKELKNLEMEGIVKRTVVDSIPVLITYSLTESAQKLFPIIEALVAWGVEHRKYIKQ